MEKAEAGCRGSTDPDSPATKRACDEWGVRSEQLKKLGWCYWWPIDKIHADPEVRWRPCSPAERYANAHQKPVKNIFEGPGGQASLAGRAAIMALRPGPWNEALITAHTLGCATLAGVDRVTSLASEGDRDLAALTLLTEGCRFFEAGQTVYLQDTSLFHNGTQVRAQGDPSVFWIHGAVQLVR